MHDIDRTQLGFEQEMYELEQEQEHEQFLGNIVGGVTGAGPAPPLHETQEMELAVELLEVANEQELEQFLDNVFSAVGDAVGRFMHSDTGRALSGTLKDAARKALPLVTRAIGDRAGAGWGHLAEQAGSLLGLELEGLSPQDQEFEAARQFVRFASTAAQHAALAPPTLSPETVAQAATTAAAHSYAPGLAHEVRDHRTAPAPYASRPPAQVYDHRTAPAPYASRPRAQVYDHRRSYPAQPTYRQSYRPSYRPAYRPGYRPPAASYGRPVAGWARPGGQWPYGYAAGYRAPWIGYQGRSTWWQPQQPPAQFGLWPGGVEWPPRRHHHHHHRRWLPQDMDAVQQPTPWEPPVSPLPDEPPAPVAPDVLAPVFPDVVPPPPLAPITPAQTNGTAPAPVVTPPDPSQPPPPTAPDSSKTPGVQEIQRAYGTRGDPMSMYEAEYEGEYEGEYQHGYSGELFGELQETELAAEILEIANEEELEQFLDGLVKAAGSFLSGPVGKALGGVLKNVAKTALPVIGGALGSAVAPGIGTAIGSKLGSFAGGLFETGYETGYETSYEQEQFETARKIVQLATSAAQAAQAAPPNIPPQVVAEQAVAEAAKRLGIVPPHQEMEYEQEGEAEYGFRGRGGYRRYGGGYGVAGGFDGSYGGDQSGDQSQSSSPTGRWIRRGNRIILFGA